VVCIIWQDKECALVSNSRRRSCRSTLDVASIWFDTLSLSHHLNWHRRFVDPNE